MNIIEINKEQLREDSEGQLLWWQDTDSGSELVLTVDEHYQLVRFDFSLGDCHIEYSINHDALKVGVIDDEKRKDDLQHPQSRIVHLLPNDDPGWARSIELALEFVSASPSTNQQTADVLKMVNSKLAGYHSGAM